jgi:molybdopterin molybdotransferase
VPDGADSVIRVEDTESHGAAVAVRSARDAGRNVRSAGEDVREGAVVLTTGTVIGPAQIALLASVGASIVHAHPRPRVAVFATGDELVSLEEFDAVLAGKRIVSSNSYGLIAAIRAAGGTPVDLGIVRDDLGATRDALARAADADLIITSAGISVGDADYLKPAVAELGGTVDFWRVRMRPGSPLAFGRVRGTPWLGLPGNPVSSLVTFELFARPAMRTLAGRANAFARRVPVAIADDLTINAPLTHFLRVTLTPDGSGPPRARLTGPQASNILSSFAHADALLVVPAEREHVRAGEILDAILLSDGAHA